MLLLLIGMVLAAPDGPSAVIDRIAASVDDVAIPESALRRAMATSALRQAPAETAEDYRLRVLEAMIDQYLEYDDAVRFGPAPPAPADVTAAVQKVRDRLKAEGRDPDKDFAAAGLKPEELRAALERQLIIQRHLSERFRPLSISDAEDAREEYDRHYVPEIRAAGRAPAPFESVADEMRVRSQQRMFDEEVEKWMLELRARSRIVIHRLPPPYPESAKPVVLSKAPPESSKSPKSKVKSQN